MNVKKNLTDEDKEILEEMEEDGVDISGEPGYKPDETKKEEEKPKEEEKKSDDDKPEEKSEGEEKPDESKKDDSKFEDDEKDDDLPDHDSEDEEFVPEDKTEGTKPKRDVKLIPISTLKSKEREWKKEKKELEDRLSNLEKKRDKPDLSEKEKDDIDKELDATEDKLSDKDKQVLEAAKEIKAWRQERETEQKRKEEAKKQKESFLTEFSALVEQNPDAKGLKRELYDLAFSERYHSYALEDILHLERSKLLPKKGKKGIESSKGGTSSGDSGLDKLKDPSYEPTSEELNSLSDKEFDEISEARAAVRGRLTIRDRQGNVRKP